MWEYEVLLFEAHAREGDEAVSKHSPWLLLLAFTIHNTLFLMFTKETQKLRTYASNCAIMVSPLMTYSGLVASFVLNSFAQITTFPPDTTAPARIAERFINTQSDLIGYYSLKGISSC
jgi:hypothetical protein